MAKGSITWTGLDRLTGLSNFFRTCILQRLLNFSQTKFTKIFRYDNV